jgi:hypothetical protein
MPKFDGHLLQEEVQELTDLLRNDPEWEGLRKAFAQKGFSINEVLLAGFLEDEEWGEYGAFVTMAGDVYEYKRNTNPGASFEFTKLRRVKNPSKAIEKYPAVEAAVRMVDKK